MSTSALLAGAVLAVATYVIRYAGVRASGSVRVGPELEEVLDRGIIVMLAAVATTSALFDGHEPADPARAVGVALGGTAALLRLPLIVVVLVAGGATAVLRLV